MLLETQIAITYLFHFLLEKKSQLYERLSRINVQVQESIVRYWIFR